MSRSLLTVVYALLTVAGAAMSLWALQLSLKYNAWTTAFRTRNPHINPPPTPEMRDLNTKIMTRLFRIFGAFIVLLSALSLLGIRSQP